MKRKLVVFGVAVLLLVVYVISINSLIYTCFDEEYQLVKENSELIDKDRVFFAVDVINVNSEFFENVDVRGWAFCATEADNLDREIDLILNSGENVYSIATNLYGRQDVINAFSNTIREGTRAGFNAKFYTLILEPGTYNIQIRVKENEENYGIIDTGKVLIKKGTISTISNK